MSYLKWIFRPSVLIVISILLLAAATRIVFPLDAGAGKPQPLALRPGEFEIAWLYPATSSTAWERFALAIRQATIRLQKEFPDRRWEMTADEHGSAATTPQVSLSWSLGTQRDSDRRLVVRWYKLTSQWTPEAWIRALLHRRPAPLAIVGGNNSYWARELAVQLEALTRETSMASRPLLLLTTATADRVTIGNRTTDEDYAEERLPQFWNEEDSTQALSTIYPDRTFRFCFSNRQMATAVTRFIWSRPDLRPDNDPAYLVQWTDDAYSRDLFAGYNRVLDYRAADSFLEQWGFLSGSVALGLPPIAAAGWYSSGFRHEAAVMLDVDSSVGTFTAPNPYEAKVVGDLLSQIGSSPRRPLLVLTGQQQPSRRLLRDLARSAPDTARRFVVAMGDALSFNTVYRDSQVTWPIQDLPFTVVFFAHRNPIDPGAGFRASQDRFTRTRTHLSGTEDVLLFRDIIEASVLAFLQRGEQLRDADDFAAGLRSLRFNHVSSTLDADGRLLFGATGQRAGGTGEHIVLVQPQFAGDRVLPRATIEVWARQGGQGWKLVNEPLVLYFNEFEVHHGGRSQ